MPRDGSGNYIRPAGQPVSSGTVIDAGVFNTLTTDIATALTGSMPRDGQAPPLQDLPMGGFKLTGLANGSAAADSVTLGQAQGAAAQWLTSIAGTANAVEGAASPAITAYAAGQTFRFVPASTNTGATTLKIGGLATQNVFAFGAACVGGELVAGVPVTVVHDGTRFQVVNSQSLPAAKGASVALLETETASGSATLDFALDLTNYGRHVIYVDNLKPVTDGVEFWGRVSSDGVTYATTAYRWSRHNVTDAATEGLAGSTNDAKFLMANAVGNVDGEQVSGAIEIASASNMGVRVSWRLSGENAAGSYYMANGMGAYVAAASTYFRLMFSAGNISSGTARMYAFKK